jgi:hypothetical protein
VDERFDVSEEGTRIEHPGTAQYLVKKRGNSKFRGIVIGMEEQEINFI